MATFYSAASDPDQSSLDSGNYVQAETRLVHHLSGAFTCANCFAGARFHGFYKATGACSSITVRSGTARTYFKGRVALDGWATAAAGPVTTVTCTSGQYVEIFQEVRKGQGSSHAMANLLLLDDTPTPTIFVTTNLYAAYAISNTPVPLTVTA